MSHDLESHGTADQPVLPPQLEAIITELKEEVSAERAAAQQRLQDTINRVSEKIHTYDHLL